MLSGTGRVCGGESSTGVLIGIVVFDREVVSHGDAVLFGMVVYDCDVVSVEDIGVILIG